MTIYDEKPQTEAIDESMMYLSDFYQALGLISEEYFGVNNYYMRYGVDSSGFTVESFFQTKPQPSGIKERLLRHFQRNSGESRQASAQAQAIVLVELDDYTEVFIKILHDDILRQARHFSMSLVIPSQTIQMTGTNKKYSLAGYNYSPKQENE